MRLYIGFRCFGNLCGIDKNKFKNHRDVFKRRTVGKYRKDTANYVRFLRTFYHDDKRKKAAVTGSLLCVRFFLCSGQKAFDF